MPSREVKNDLLKTYGDDLKKYNEEMERIKAQNDLLAANAAQEDARNAKAKADREENIDERYSKSEKAQDAFKKKMGEAKESGLKAYDSFSASIMDMLAYAQVFVDSVHADIWAYLGGPLKDLAMLGVSELASGVASAASDFAKQAKEQNIPLEYFDIPPLELVKVKGNGELEFTSFENIDRLKDKNIPQDLLHKADIANQAAVNFLIRDAGYKYDDAEENFYKHDDEGNKQNLKQEDLENILSSANFKEQMDKAVKNVETYDEELKNSPRP